MAYGPTALSTSHAWTSPERLRAAGYGTTAAIVLVVLGAIALAIYFSSGEVGNVFGPISDIVFIGVMVLLIPAVLATRALVAARTGAWFTVMSVLAIAGLLTTAAGQALLVAGLIPLVVSFATFGIGLALLLLWGVSLWVPAVRQELLPRSVATYPVAAVVLLGLASAGWFALPGAAGYALALALGVAILAWLAALARMLLSAAAAHPGAA